VPERDGLVVGDAELVAVVDKVDHDEAPRPGVGLVLARGLDDGRLVEAGGVRVDAEDHFALAELVDAAKHDLRLGQVEDLGMGWQKEQRRGEPPISCPQW
jgi:hypothetical protein